MSASCSKGPDPKTRWLACATIMLCVAVLGPRSSPAQEKTTGSEPPTLTPASETFLLGNIVFALFHEFGHAIIRDFNVPLLGLEENSADTIAAVSLVMLDRQHPDTGFGAALGATALAQAFVWRTGLERNSEQATLWAQHQLSAQRYARLVCLLYGSDPKRHGWLAESARMEEIRTEGCEDEWALAERAVLWVRDTYGIPPAERMDTDEFRATVNEYASRLRCRLDNAKLPEPQHIDCTNPEARKAREGAGT